MYKSKKKNLDFKNSLELDHCCEDPCIKYLTGNKVCTNCGTIVGQIFEVNERRAYTSEEIRDRRHSEPIWREFGPRTNLSSCKIDSKGKILNSSNRSKFSRLSKIQNSLISSRERNFWEAKPKLKMYASKLNLPEYIVETAWRIYVEVAKKKLTMGRSIDGFVAASIYTAIRIHKFPKLLEDVSDAALIPKRTLFRSIGMIISEILPLLGLHYHPISAEKLVYLFGNELKLPIGLQLEAVNILKEISENGVNTGKDPKGLAAAVLYYAAKDTIYKKTQSEIAVAAKVTEVTIRSRLKDI
ncbi:MAG: transcription initiation factor IIB [Promethearchaeota archaeon]